MLPNSQIRAAVSGNSVNEDKRTVDLTWTTGSKGLRSSWGERYYEELSLDPSHVDLTRLNDGSHPLLAAHDDQSLDSVIGVVERAWLEGNQAGATVRFAKDDISERVFQKVKDGILRNVSVGYSVQEYTEVDGDPSDQYPTYRATRWTPSELSIVPIGFDKDAKVRNQETQTENEVEIISRSPDLKETSAMTEQEKKALAEQAAAEERTRVLTIRKEVKAAGLPEDMANDYIERGTSAEEARTNIQLFAKYSKEQSAPVQNTVRVEVGADNQEMKRQGVEAALLVRIDGNNFSHTDASKAFAGKSLLRMVEDLIGRRAGETDAQLAKRAMATADLPLIMANVAEKAMQKRYQLAPRTWSQWAKTGTLRNYKTASQVRAGDFGNLAERAENADYGTATIGEQGETAQLKDYGVIHAFSSKMLVNDDLSAIQKVMSEGGVAAARLENKLVYTALKTNKTMGDGVALYHATHKNLGTAGAISETTFSEAFKAMRNQKSVDGRDTLNLAPAHLIVGPELETAARKFLAVIAPAATGDVNVFAGSVKLTVDGEIADDSYFFAADSALIDTVTLFRLEGQESPRIESRIKWENDSLELKVAHAAAAEPMDYRGLFKNEVSSS